MSARGNSSLFQNDVCKQLNVTVVTNDAQDADRNPSTCQASNSGVVQMGAAHLWHVMHMAGGQCNLLSANVATAVLRKSWKQHKSAGLEVDVVDRAPCKLPYHRRFACAQLGAGL